MSVSNSFLRRHSELRDAVVLSGWNWETFNVPERIALALANLGARVLYCENPVSRLRHRGRALGEIEKGIYGFGLEFAGHKINRIPFGSRLQAKFLASLILEQVRILKLDDPVIVYPHGEWLIPLCRELKKKNFRLVHVCMDYPEPGQERHIELSDLTLVIPKSVFHQLSAKYEEKIALIPQVTRLLDMDWRIDPDAAATGEFAAIPRPRLGYLGPVTNRLNLPLLGELLSSRPDWHFLHFGATKCLSLPNVHVVTWREPEKLKDVTANLDLGLMPYDCYSNKNFHCMPLKVFDYFHFGLPVVSTPIVNLWEFADTIYFGDNANELCHAVQLALDEPADNPKSRKRVTIARDHSIDALSSTLRAIFHAQDCAPPNARTSFP